MGFPVKVHVLTYEAIAPTIYDKATGVDGHKIMNESMMATVEALPLNNKFVLFDDSTGHLSDLIWLLHARQRLAGALTQNLMMLFDDDFPETEMFKRLTGMRRYLAACVNNRDVGPFIKGFNNGHAIWTEDAEGKQGTL